MQEVTGFLRRKEHGALEKKTKTLHERQAITLSSGRLLPM
jgi:hypothetical protein